MLETELYEPIQSFLSAQGYTVRGEIGAIDVFAMKGEHSIAVELKTVISLKLIYQAIDRQKIADNVYIAVPKSAMKSHHDSYRSFTLLLKRLSIGLLVIHPDQVEVVLDAKDYDLSLSRKKNTNKKQRLIKEFSHLKNNVNIGGKRGKKMTLYREKVIKIANVLLENPVLSPKQIKNFTQIEEVSSILQKNYYGWFMKVERGLYGLSELGVKEIEKIAGNITT
ncbi:MAG: hypothetical protein A2084_02885 [Tenericutes bacterium GWC2_39_45]|nr:MAG: hypothetical protein A2Y43_00475 [Tenericutes bacterium GWA2_38_26]OHE30334.1 MAG: hypothetical protein A2084_02885 [Tenericutes bacterium GWC2_39_45]OHE32525.1 MAG: hypothetical protein A2009_05460 [Tenericutes bacterium GWD2_38_27]HBG33182.1 hypothetical protein [Acholeplasmataceae bacterium]HCB66737.1 hypothetical protein [Acholeplasmataceae bacterium]